MEDEGTRRGPRSETHRHPQQRQVGHRGRAGHGCQNQDETAKKDPAGKQDTAAEATDASRDAPESPLPSAAASAPRRRRPPANARRGIPRLAGQQGHDDQFDDDQAAHDHGQHDAGAAVQPHVLGLGGIVRHGLVLLPPRPGAPTTRAARRPARAPRRRWRTAPPCPAWTKGRCRRPAQAESARAPRAIVRHGAMTTAVRRAPEGALVGLAQVLFGGEVACRRWSAATCRSTASIPRRRTARTERPSPPAPPRSPVMPFIGPPLTSSASSHERHRAGEDGGGVERAQGYVEPADLRHEPRCAPPAPAGSSGARSEGGCIPSSMNATTRSPLGKNAPTSTTMDASQANTRPS